MTETQIITLVSGEMLISEIEYVEDKDGIKTFYPAAMMPMQEGKLGFMKYLPFSDHDKDIIIRRSTIVSMSFPMDELKKAYEDWVTNVKKMEVEQRSGIVQADTKIIRPDELNRR